MRTAMVRAIKDGDTRTLEAAITICITDGGGAIALSETQEWRRSQYHGQRDSGNGKLAGRTHDERPQSLFTHLGEIGSQSNARER